MIIDLICERKNGENYKPEQFYFHCLQYGGESITRAMDAGTEIDVKRALCEYIDVNEYNPLLKIYINSVNWL